MKTVILSALLLLSAITSAFAQDKGKSIIAFSYGLLPTEDIIADALRTRLNAFPGKHKSMRPEHGAISVSYKYHMTDKFALGGSSTYNPNADVNGYMFQNLRHNDRQTLTTTVEGTFFWLQRKHFQLYSLAGAGLFAKKIARDRQGSYTWYGHTMQVSPAGIRFGDGAGVFIEVGYGYKGFLNGGLSWKISKNNFQKKSIGLMILHPY